MVRGGMRLRRIAAGIAAASSRVQHHENLEKCLDPPGLGEQSKRGRTYEDETRERPRAGHIGEAPPARRLHGGGDDVRHRRPRVAAEDRPSGRSGYLRAAGHHDGRQHFEPAGR